MHHLPWPRRLVRQREAEASVTQHVAGLVLDEEGHELLEPGVRERLPGEADDLVDLVVARVATVCAGGALFQPIGQLRGVQKPDWW